MGRRLQTSALFRNSAKTWLTSPLKKTGRNTLPSFYREAEPIAWRPVLGATITPKDKLLICSNGAYGDRMGNIAEYYHLDYDMLAFEETEQVSVEYVDDYLSNNSDITHVAFVHCETTTGILNPIKELSHIVKMHGKKLIVDCMSSFGGIPLDVNELGIDFLISSSNKCIQGVPDSDSSSPAVRN